VVAFANSVPVGLPAVLYIGVKDNGEIETPQTNLDKIQTKFNTHMQSVYPRIAYAPKIVAEGGRQALAVMIPGSELRPHFAGLSYVRKRLFDLRSFGGTV
jgi:predicted HTH transcriptional regulator